MPGSSQEAAPQRLQAGKGTFLRGGQPITEQLLGLKLGVLVKTGLSGRIYRGVWEGHEVAVKVCPHTHVPACACNSLCMQAYTRACMCGDAHEDAHAD